MDKRLYNLRILTLFKMKPKKKTIQIVTPKANHKKKSRETDNDRIMKMDLPSLRTTSG